jgi:hypothetical protein
MAMTKQLWSISGLAVELAKDRRTIARALNSVPPDGHISGEKAWYLTTVLEAFAGGRARTPTLETNTIVTLLLDRLDRLGPPNPLSEERLFTIEEFASVADQSPANVLDCLRAGMLFVREGDWRTGAGFQLRLIWAMEWQFF